MKVKITVNGFLYEREILENMTLLRFLREELGLTGTKEGCGAGECGACTVIANGWAVNSCLVLAVELDGGNVLTVEGIAEDGKLSEIQQVLQKHHAVQCGFCSPGMIMSLRAFLDSHATFCEADIYRAIEGNFCRCTGYKQIVEAIMELNGKPCQEDLKYA